MPDPIHVLYIEDSEIQRLIVHDILQNEGFDVITAASGNDGLTILREQPVDVVLCDLAMPEMDGLEVLRQIRALSPTLPFVILTAQGTVNTAEKGLNLGANHYLQKPVEFDELVRLIHHLHHHNR
ncbi:MAG: response regulator [Gemmatimonadetes bacterium]|nr:MAG: response regulator [Gemmatimonadota bacterium]